MSNCDSNRECANCILDFVADAADEFEVDEFFMRAMMNLTTGLPEGYVWSFNVENNNEEIITLPMSFCPMCASGAVILNGTDSTDYRIDGELYLLT